MTFSAGNSRENEVILPNIQINFSTTSKSGDQLSATFGENIGFDDTIVYSGSIRVFYKSFDQNMHIVLNPPFLFNPRAGNLLMDVRNYQTIPPFPQIPGTFPWVTRGFGNADDRSSIVVAYNVNSTNATFLSTAAISTRFTVTPIPRLTVFLISSNLVFRWVNQPGEMLLEQSSSINPGSTWAFANGLVSTNGAYKEVTLPLDKSTNAQFFRLVLPPSGQSAGGPDANLKVEISMPKR